MNGTVVFLGPSLPISRARAVLPEATYLPPIRRGDLIAALRDQPAIVGIIDGQFLQSLAVSPLEIFEALRAGTTVLGAASMGALRAVEMGPFGMIGVGTIFRWFRDERLVAEDELAVAFDPGTGSALSDALVNMRYALSRAAAEQVIGRDTRRLLIQLARSRYFPERTYDLTMRLAEHRVPGIELDRLRVWLRHRAPDLKAEDALRLLRLARRLSTAVLARRGEVHAMNPIVEQIIGKLIIDPMFRQAFKTDRATTLARYRLTPTEREGLMLFDVQAIEVAVRNLQMSKAIPVDSMFW
jgi:TfuA protein